MVHKESIGRVMGEAGKTYIPSVNDNGDGTFSFTFRAETSANIDNVINDSANIRAPFIIPHIVTENEEKVLKFKLGTEEDLNNLNNIAIPYSELKGEDGISTIGIETIDLTDYSLDDLLLNTIYIDVKTDDNNADNIDENVNAYIVYEDHISHQRKLEQINSIGFDKFYTKSEIDDKYDEIVDYIGQQVAGVIHEQGQINNLLNNGLTIQQEEYTSNDNVVNVMSDASIEDVKSQIYEELKEYVKESDIVFNEETGTLNIKY